jgi:hypothetical protein
MVVHITDGLSTAVGESLNAFETVQSLLRNSSKKKEKGQVQEMALQFKKKLVKGDVYGLNRLVKCGTFLTLPTDRYNYIYIPVNTLLFTIAFVDLVLWLQYTNTYIQDPLWHAWQGCGLQCYREQGEDGWVLCLR